MRRDLNLTPLPSFGNSHLQWEKKNLRLNGKYFKATQQLTKVYQTKSRINKFCLKITKIKFLKLKILLRC